MKWLFSRLVGDWLDLLANKIGVGNSYARMLEHLPEGWFDQA